MFARPGLSTAFRTFSTSACRSANFISNIGKQPIKIPANVNLEPIPTGLAVSGPLGSTSVPFPGFVKLDFSEPEHLTVSVEDRTHKTQRSIWGRTRTLIANAITGLTDGFTTPMYLVGVGYRAALEDDPMGVRPGWTGKRLNMKLGFSHPVYVPIPDYIKIEVVSPTKILASGTDKQILGLFTAAVRKNRPPEPYKGKGIIVGQERVKIKNVRKK
ncbi:50S ribosomal protein L6 [Phanerochaete sordida]|uniref:50S ribosomal protein L6 n=1 Tax=Phanerochaete sordida TaxID=48140 RepID=A0A9P3LJD1_9APHY|nr:50S ribosomal protein L6 [Phanerochaete sordida]